MNESLPPGFAGLAPLVCPPGRVKSSGYHPLGRLSDTNHEMREGVSHVLRGGEVAITLTELQSKVMDYLIGRKTPADAAAVSKKFIISNSKASVVLFQLYDMGLTEVVQVGKKKFYKVKD